MASVSALQGFPFPDCESAAFLPSARGTANRERERERERLIVTVLPVLAYHNRARWRQNRLKLKSHELGFPLCEPLDTRWSGMRHPARRSRTTGRFAPGGVRRVGGYHRCGVVAAEHRSGPVVMERRDWRRHHRPIGHGGGSVA